MTNQDTTWPHKNKAGETVWACCESSIGPVCQHKADPDDRVAVETLKELAR